MRYHAKCANGHFFPSSRKHLRPEEYCPTCLDVVEVAIIPPVWTFHCECGQKGTWLNEETPAWRYYRRHTNKHPDKWTVLMQDDNVRARHTPCHATESLFQPIEDDQG